MTIDNSKQNQQTRDQIGSEPSIHEAYMVGNEIIKLEECSTIIQFETIGHSWIVGTSTNGIVGTNTGTQDGSQQVVGGAGRINTLQKVTNPNDTFIDRLNYNTFEDSSSTATFSTANQLITFATSEFYLTEPIYQDSNNILQATVLVKGTDLSNLTLQLSANNGSNFENVTNKVKHTFTNIGTALLFKATATDIAEINFIKIEYIR